jgi:hypothetical protein
MLLLGLVLGPGSVTADTTETDAMEPERAPVDAHGYTVRGPGFYVWDEDAHEAVAWAEEITGPDASSETESNLGGVLRDLSQLERTWLITICATSEDEATRRRLASALAAPIDAVGARWVLEHLQRDPSAEVRRLAREAAEARELV